VRRIAKLVLKNFQKHKKREFSFKGGLNVIIGDNNSGKSSIIRAIAWVSTNKPNGDWMRMFDPEGEEGERLTATVEMHLDSGVIITRTKGNNINEYRLSTCEDPFTSVGRGAPPAPVLDVLGQVQLPMDKSIIPFLGTEDELPFMISESGPTRGGMLNYLTGIDIGDRMRKGCKKDIRAITADINSHENQKKEVEVRLEKYAELDKMESKLEKIQKADAKIVRMQEKLAKVKSLASKLKKHKVKIKYRKVFLVKARRVIKVGSLYCALDALWTQVKAHTCSKARVNAVLACKGSIKGLDKQQVKVSKVKDSLSKLYDLRAHAECLEDHCKRYTTSKAEAEAELEKYDVCPVCGGEL